MTLQIDIGCVQMCILLGKCNLSQKSQMMWEVVDKQIFLDLGNLIPTDQVFSNDECTDQCLFLINQNKLACCFVVCNYEEFTNVIY